MRAAHLTYWANHPRAVCILERHRDKLNTWLDNMAGGGAGGSQPPGLMMLTTGLSRPFRQLERLAGVQKEVWDSVSELDRARARSANTVNCGLYWGCAVTGRRRPTR